MSADHNKTSLFDRIRNGDRIALSRAITIVESQHPSHSHEAKSLLDACMQVEGNSMRLAITGAPGVGKSSLIEAMSRHILDEDLTLAVLAIDPTSHITGGSILGDKTRMQSLSQDPRAYIRPTPSGTQGGGVSDRTREVILLCEAAGFDVIIVETVGVGQSETQVRTMVDLLALLITPGGGDEVQGIKRGILEVADMIIINKSDGDMKKKALETQASYSHALRILHQNESLPPVLLCSAEQDMNISPAWNAMKERFQQFVETGSLHQLRNEQLLHWFDLRVRQELLHTCLEHPKIREEYALLRKQIGDKVINVQSALSMLHDSFRDVMRG